MRARRPRSQDRVVSPEFIHNPNTFSASGVAQVGTARLYTGILVIFDGNRLRPAGGRSARRIYHDGPAPYAEGDRSLAGRKYSLDVRPDCRFLQAPPPRSESDRR